MTATQDTASPAVTLALAIDEVLALGLPAPVLAVFYYHPAQHRSGRLPEVSFQFGAPDQATAVRSWADWFNVPARVRDDDGIVWHEACFTHGGVRFTAYCRIRADQ